MPVSITIRNVPDEVRDELAARAARSGRSLQEFLSAEFVRIASTPSAAESAARARTRSSPLSTRGAGDNGCRQCGIRGGGDDRVERRGRRPNAGRASGTNPNADSRVEQRLLALTSA